MKINTEKTVKRRLGKDKLAQRFAPYEFDPDTEDEIRELLDKRQYTAGQVVFMIDAILAKVKAND